MQPYRKGARMPGAALSAMLRGQASYLPHPHHAKRQAQKMAAKRRRRGRVV